MAELPALIGGNRQGPQFVAPRRPIMTDEQILRRLGRLEQEIRKLSDLTSQIIRNFTLTATARDVTATMKDIADLNFRLVEMDKKLKALQDAQSNR